MHRFLPRSFAGQVLLASIIVGVGSSLAWAGGVRLDGALAGALFGLICGAVSYVAINAFDRGPHSGPLWSGLRKDSAARLRR